MNKRGSLNRLIKQYMDKHWLELLLDTHSRETHKERESDGYFHPSSAGKCPRELWYELMGYEVKPVSVMSLRHFETGKIFHTALQEKFKSMNILDCAEKKVEYEDKSLPIKGTLDAVIYRPSNGKPYLIEIKSHKDSLKDSLTIDYNDDSTVGSWDELKEPHINHRLQWNLYSLMTGVIEGCVFYINKNDLRYKLFDVQQDRDLINKELIKYRDVYEHVKQKVLYPYQPEENHIWCPYKDRCELDYRDEMRKQGNINE